MEIPSGSTERELQLRKSFIELFRNCPIPDGEILQNLGLFLNRQTLSRILFMHELYQKIINVHGIVIEFGVRWGQNLALLQSFRGMYEPYNYNRKIVGFDTFGGFPRTDPKDGKAEIITEGAYAVTEAYDQYLDRILDYHEHESPISHIKKYTLIKGDASVTIENYLNEHPETIIALAFFDFDLYEPTKKCLEAIKKHLAKGCVLGFDDLNYHEFPGVTLALKEVFGLDKYRLQRSPNNPLIGYVVVE